MSPKKQTNDNSTYPALKRDISSGSLGKLYVFHGEEAYLRSYYLEEMKKKLIPEGVKSFNYHTLEGKDCSADALTQLVDCLPMMSERTLIVVTDYDLYKASEGERRAMAALFSELPDYCCLVFVYDIISYKKDARMKQLSSALQSYGTVVKFERQKQGDLVDWIHRRFRALGHTIDTVDAQYLIFLCGDLMTGLISEIEKIGAFAKHDRVTRDEIDTVAVPQLDAVIFQMTSAITEKNFDKAASVLADLLHMQEPPIRILSVLGKQLRQLLSARLAFERGKQTTYLMELWGMRSSYPAEKLMTAARRFPLSWCRRATIRCAKTDLSLKSVCGADGRDLLVSLLLELSLEVPHATH